MEEEKDKAKEDEEKDVFDSRLELATDMLLQAVLKCANAKKAHRKGDAAAARLALQCGLLASSKAAAAMKAEVAVLTPAGPPSSRAGYLRALPEILAPPGARAELGRRVATDSCRSCTDNQC